MIKEMTNQELRDKIAELDDSFLSYAYVKELESREKPITNLEDND